MSVEKSDIVIYRSESGAASLEVHLDHDTVWLTQDQMTVLFARDQSVISRHIRNVFKGGELEEKSNMQKMHFAFSDKPVTLYASAEEMRQYRLKVERFIRDNSNHITINKLRMNRQITRTDLEELERLLFTAEEVGNRERFEKVFGHQQSLGMFIRKLVGLDREAASEAFGEFLHNTTYSANLIRFIDQIISYLTQNGTMDPGLLYEPPFTDIHNEGLDGVFGDAGATKIIHLLQDIELRAAA